MATLKQERHLKQLGLHAQVHKLYSGDEVTVFYGKQRQSSYPICGECGRPTPKLIH